jgi:hypothetical protein
MRPLCSALFAALVLCTPALAVDGTREARGTIAALIDTSITIKSGSTSASCSLSKYAPALDGYRVGDRVAIVCLRSGDHWRLTKIRKLEPKPTGSTDGQKTNTPKTEPPTTSPPVVTFGTLTSLTATSLTVKDGDRSITCTVDASSPPLGDYHVGDRVYVGCAGGVLVKIAKPKSDTPPTTTPPVVTFGGTLTSLTATNLTVQDGTRSLTCSIGPSSPPLGDYHVGDHVYVACSGGVLLKIAKPTTAPPPTTPTMSYVNGTISAISTSALVVHGDGGDVTCKLTDKSPRLGDFHVGDRVRAYCADGVLVGIVRL